MATYYVSYEDEGPYSSCNSNEMQPLRKLYIFTDYEKMQEFCNSVNKRKTFRLRPKILGYWEESKYSKDVERL